MCEIIDYTDLVGVPFINQGRNPQKGLDCYGLVKEVFRRYGCGDIGEYWCDAEDKEYINKVLRKAVSGPRWREINYKDGEDIPVPALIALRFNSPPASSTTPAYISATGCLFIRGSG